MLPSYLSYSVIVLLVVLVFSILISEIRLERRGLINGRRSIFGISFTSFCLYVLFFACIIYLIYDIAKQGHS